MTHIGILPIEKLSEDSANQKSFMDYAKINIGINMNALNLFKIRKSKKIVNVEEVETDFGSGYKAEVLIGNSLKECHLIQDKYTGQWKTLGDPNACQVLGDVLDKLGAPIVETSTSEKLKEQPL